MPPQQPAPLPAAEVVLTFLESVGRRSEAELYLRLFQKLPKESFAIIAPGGPVVRHALGSLVEQLRFLGDLGLFAPVVLGLFNPEAAAAGSERLARRLPSVGLAACPHEATEPDLSQRMREELRAEQIPVLHFRPQEGIGFAERLSFLAEFVRALDTRKVVFLRRRGGVVSKGQGAGALMPVQEPLAPDGRISVINLRTDRGALSRRHLGKREVELVDAANVLIQAREPKSLLVSITSPLNLLKELFTVKGAGTLIKSGTEIQRFDDYSALDVGKLSNLLESSFQRGLAPEFFARRPLAVYVESSYRGAALLLDQGPAPYLSKFAVEPEAQGEGIGNDLWQAMVRDFPRVYWRSRPENPIHHWYQGICDGMVRRGAWNVYWRGIDPAQLPELITCAENLPSDFVSEPLPA